MEEVDDGLSARELAELRSYGLGLAEQIQGQTGDKRSGPESRPNNHSQEKEKEHMEGQAQGTQSQPQSHVPPQGTQQRAPVLPIHPLVLSAEQSMQSMAYDIHSALDAFKTREALGTRLLRTAAITATSGLIVGGVVIAVSWLSRPAMPDAASLPAKK